MDKNLFQSLKIILPVSIGSALVTYNVLVLVNRNKNIQQKLQYVRKIKRKVSKIYKYSKQEKIFEEILEAQNCLIQQLKVINSKTSKIQKVPHLSIDLKMANIPTIISPLLGQNKYLSIFGGRGFLPQNSFVYQGAFIISTTQFKTKIENEKLWMCGGPRKNIFFNKEEVKAAIVTCGGLCPGLNVVIRQIVMSLNFLYNVKQIYGIQYGYSGFYKYEWIKLNHQDVKELQNKGGTILGSSRGGFDLELILKNVIQRGINQLYIIGGDGTHRGIYQLYNQIKQRNLKISVIGIPKTIDNDIPIIDNSFGFQTSVSEAIRAIRSALVQSTCADYGIGLVRLMGRSAGWIAMDATKASRDVDICIVPQYKFSTCFLLELYGQKGVLQYIYNRIKIKRHMVIVVAEGAGSSVIDLKLQETQQKDLSGNKRLIDIGVILKKQIVDYCKGKGLQITLKYIDPTYMIRTVQANTLDKKKCVVLSGCAVHGAMAGFTGFTVGSINNSVAMIPIEQIINRGCNTIQQDDQNYHRMIAGTGQPAFI